MPLQFHPPGFDPSQAYSGIEKLGQGIGQGVASGFDKAVEGIVRGQVMRKQAEQQRLQEAYQRLAFMQQSGGLDPRNVMAGQDLANANPGLGSIPPGPTAMTADQSQAMAGLNPQQMDQFQNYQSFERQMREAASTASEKNQLGLEESRTKIQANKSAAAVNTIKANNLLKKPAASNSDTSRIRKELQALSKPFYMVRDSYSRVQASAKNPSAAGDLALIFNYMKILDPGSVVREGEFATAQNAAGIPDRIKGLYNRVINGERLAEETRADFIERAGDLYNSQLAIQKQTEGSYSELAKRRGINPADVVLPSGLPPDVIEKIAVNKKTGQRITVISTDGGNNWVPK